MKNILTSLLLVISLTTAAQTTKKDTLCDRLYAIKKINSHFYLLSLGGYYPNQKYTVVLKGPQDNLELFNFVDSLICVAGVRQNYKGKPELVVAGRFLNIHR
jgi:hypothetical protein